MTAAEYEEKREEIEHRLKEGGSFTSMDDPITQGMLECSLHALSLDTKKRKSIFLSMLDDVVDEAYGKERDHSAHKSAMIMSLFAFTSAIEGNVDRGNAVDKTFSEQLLTVLSRTSEEVHALCGDGDMKASLLIDRFIMSVIEGHWEETGSITWWNRFVYEATSWNYVRNSSDMEGPVKVLPFAEKALRTIESFPEPELDEDRACFIGMLSWWCYLGWKDSEVRDERKERRYLRRCVRNLQNMDGNPIENPDYVDRILNMALELLG